MHVVWKCFKQRLYVLKETTCNTYEQNINNMTLPSIIFRTGSKKKYNTGRWAMSIDWGNCLATYVSLVRTALSPQILTCISQI